MEKLKFNWCAAELSTIYKVKHKPSVKIGCSQDSYNYIKNIFETQEQHIEQFNVFYLNRNNMIIGWKHIGIGGVSGVVADTKIIMKHALDICASAIILSHNHPSGKCTPSQTDISLTKSIGEFGKCIDLKLLDHLIFTDNGYFSFADEGLLVN